MFMKSNDFMLEYRLPGRRTWKQARDYTDGNSAVTMAALIRIIKPEIAVRVRDWDGNVLYELER